MPTKKSPTSSLPVVELFVKRVWYRSRARIRRMRSGGAPPGVSTTRSSPATKLPHEIVEIIFAHLASDLLSLWSCSRVCYSWYIAAVPHTHPVLTVITDTWGWGLSRPNPIRHMHKFGFLPFVKIVRIRSDSNEFSPRGFNYKFSELTNVQRLEIDNLDIPSFMPKVRQYFRPFLPTLRALYLRAPKGSNRQIIFFVGSFPHLEDLSLECYQSYKRELAEDATLIPPFAPPLQGRLVVRDWRKQDLFQEMVLLFGGLGFRVMNLFNVLGTRFLLRSCAKTLRMLELHQTDPLAKFPLKHFDLSQNKSLQTLEVSVDSIDGGFKRYGSTDLYFASSFHKKVLSTIRSPAFSFVQVAYRVHNFRAITATPPYLHHLSQDEEMKEAELHRQRFGLLRAVHKVRDFRLVLYADACGPAGEHVVRILKKAVAAEKARGGFDVFFPEPVVTAIPRSFSYVKVRP